MDVSCYFTMYSMCFHFLYQLYAASGESDYLSNRWMDEWVNGWMDLCFHECKALVLPLRSMTAISRLLLSVLVYGNWFLKVLFFLLYVFQGWRANDSRGWRQRSRPYSEVPQPAHQEITLETRGSTNNLPSFLFDVISPFAHITYSSSI